MKDLQFLWQTEDTGLTNDLTENKKEESNTLFEALNEHYKRTTVRDAEGFYEIRLPFKDSIRTLPDNRKLAVSRTLSFVEKLKKTPTKLKAVDDEFKKLLETGYIEHTVPVPRGQLSHYLPVQAVFKQDPNSPFGLKTRIVKDASAKLQNRPSLNQVLHCGENLLPDVIKVLLKFRQYKYCLSADIQNFKIAKPDRNFLKFFWPLGISEKASTPPQEFQATRLDFGLICSPYLHCQGLRLHLEKAEVSHPSDGEFIREVMKHTYMDDLTLGSNSLQEAKHRIQLLFDIFEEAHFPLKKWNTNAPELAKFIEEISPVDNPIITTAKPDAKFLGVLWNQVTDRLSTPTTKAVKELSTGTPTKRKLLRGVAAIYDCYGILAPICMNAKILFQTLWKDKIGWDEPLVGTNLATYESFHKLLSSSAHLSINRHLSASTAKKEIHIFCDASKLSYGCVAYLREQVDRKLIVSFLIAKGRVAPVRPMSIQRLELLGALLAARMLNKLKEIMKFQIK